jgi:hypothetical protein
MARRPDSAAPSTRHPSQLLALAIGAVYTLVGIAGFFVTGFENFAAETDKTLLEPQTGRPASTGAISRICPDKRRCRPTGGARSWVKIGVVAR